MCAMAVQSYMGAFFSFGLSLNADRVVGIEGKKDEKSLEMLKKNTD